MEKQDWLVLAIGESIQPIQLQKTLFKFAKESGVPVTELYEFVPYNWGPCSFQIYEDLSVLRTNGLVEVKSSGRGWNLYSLTKQGRAKEGTLRKQASSALVKVLDEVRNWVTSRSFEKLLKDVYKDYPQYTTQSLFTS